MPTLTLETNVKVSKHISMSPLIKAGQISNPKEFVLSLSKVEPNSLPIFVQLNVICSSVPSF